MNEINYEANKMKTLNLTYSTMIIKSEREKKLIRKLFSFFPLFSHDLHFLIGKCSHGDLLDTASLIEPTGGINKDDLDAKHGFLHLTAANVAMAATRELLEDIRGAAGDRNFLWYKTENT